MPFLTPHSLVTKGERATQRLHEQSLKPALPRLKAWKAVLDPTSRLRSPLHSRPVVRLGRRRRSTSQTALGSHRPISRGVRRAVLLTRPPSPRRLPTCREGIVAAQSRRGHFEFPCHNHPPGQSQEHHRAARHVRAEKGRTEIPQCFSTAGRAHCPRNEGGGRTVPRPQRALLPPCGRREKCTAGGCGAGFLERGRGSPELTRSLCCCGTASVPHPTPQVR